MPKKKPYFPNNWREYKEADESWFEPIPYDVFTEWKLAGWELPSSVACLIRVTDLKSKRTKEYTYQKMGCAKNKLERLINRGGVEITVCDEANIHHLLPEESFNETYE